ncbi:MAG TPA: PKD domain-containing protein [Candidatus Dormibacteraeota bacterium]
MKRALAGLVGMALGVISAVSAAPLTALAAPANDDITGAIAIAAVPYSTSMDVSGASTAVDDPGFCYNSGSVWFSLTPAQNETLTINTNGSTYFAVPSVYTGSPGLLNPVACSYSSSLSFSAAANTTYYLMVGTCCFGGTLFSGNLVLNVAGPPANDSFAGATAIGSLPYTDHPDTTLASSEAGEPTPTCAYGGLGRSVWYSYTPVGTGSVSAQATSMFTTVVAVYSGSSLSSLSQLACSSYGGLATVRALAGQTYYFQTFQLFGAAGPLTFTLEVSPPPQVGWTNYPFDPSIFDNVQFWDTTYDPAGVGVQSWSWSFGDGATAATQAPQHNYAADGSYQVALAITTFDGRTGSLSRTLTVKTHDVAIVKFSTPNTAKTGQTKPISVQVVSNRYPETVQVDLYRSVPGGFQLVGSLTNAVPVSSNKPVSFDFSYTFTGPCPPNTASGTRCGDSTLGTVTFEAVASIVGARDALPADNTAVSPLVTVN